MSLKRRLKKNKMLTPNSIENKLFFSKPINFWLQYVKLNIYVFM